MKRPVCFGETAYADVCGVHCVEIQAIADVSEERVQGFSVGTVLKRDNIFEELVFPLRITLILQVGRDSSVRIVTRFGLDGPGIESRWEWHFPHPSRPALGPTCRITLILQVGRDSSVRIVTRFGLDGPGIESRWEWNFPHPSRPALGPTQPPIQWVPGLSRG